MDTPPPPCNDPVVEHLDRMGKGIETFGIIVKIGLTVTILGALISLFAGK